MRTRPLPLAASLACATPAPPAFAHAVLMGGEPEARATVAPGPAEVASRFNSHLDRARSRLVLVRPDRAEAVLALHDDGC